jgi:hypothetical protein
MQFNIALTLFLAGLLASWNIYAQDDVNSLRADTGDNAQVIGTGNFVNNGRNTRLKVTGKYRVLCTTLNNYREVCLNIVASSTMEDITVTTSSTPDGTPLTNFAFNDKSTRSRVYIAYAVARFLGRLAVVADALGDLDTNATTPGTDTARGKCGGNSKLTTGTSNNSEDCDTGSGGSSTGSSDPGGGGGGGGSAPGNIPDATRCTATASKPPPAHGLA